MMKSLDVEQGNGHRDGHHRVSEVVMEQIKTLVRNNEFKPGSRLPSERDLAQQLGVSRPTVRHALSTLARMGILETRPGSGTLVAPTSTNILKVPFELMMMLDRPTVYDLYEIRELLEVHLAGRAAERRTPDDLAAMVLALEHMRATLADIASYQPHHIAFHQALADAAHNPVSSRIISCLHEGIRACAEATAPGILDSHRTFGIHEHIFEAIRQQDATEARRCMTIHFAMAIEELRIAEQAAKRSHHLYPHGEGVTTGLAALPDSPIPAFLPHPLPARDEEVK